MEANRDPFISITNSIVPPFLSFSGNEMAAFVLLQLKFSTCTDSRGREEAPWFTGAHKGPHSWSAIIACARDRGEKRPVQKVERATPIGLSLLGNPAVRLGHPRCVGPLL